MFCLHLAIIAFAVEDGQAIDLFVESGFLESHGNSELRLHGNVDPDVVLAAEADTRERPSGGINEPDHDKRREADRGQADANTIPTSEPLPSWIYSVNAGYDRGFFVATGPNVGIDRSEAPFALRLNGLGQLRHTIFDSRGEDPDLNQFQLKRGRLAFSGNVFSPSLQFFVQLDGRSSAGDEFRLLDYLMEFDMGREWFGLNDNALVFKAGRYKVPFTLSRYLSAREFQFSDRSVSSMFFDVNRSLAWGLAGETDCLGTPVVWETSLFNGFVTGGAETGSAGTLDNNFAYSARIAVFPSGDWGSGDLADLDWHDTLATRLGAAYAGTTNDRLGLTEFDAIRVVDSGERLGSLLPDTAESYDVNTYCVDASCKYRGWSLTSEYYFRHISSFEGVQVRDLFDHGFWLQLGKFVIPRKLELLSRWSRVVGSSGTLGAKDESTDEVAGGLVWYFRDQNAKFTADATRLNGAPISSSALDIRPGYTGWLIRTQIQIAF